MTEMEGTSSVGVIREDLNEDGEWTDIEELQDTPANHGVSSSTLNNSNILSDILESETSAKVDNNLSGSVPFHRNGTVTSRKPPSDCAEENLSVGEFKQSKNEETVNYKSDKEKRSNVLNSFLVPLFSLVSGVNKTNETIFEKYSKLKARHHDYVVAAAHVDDAMKSRGTHGKAEVLQTSISRQRCYAVTESIWFRLLMYAVIVTHSSLAFGEPTQKHLIAGGTYVSVITLHGVCVLFYIIDVTLQMYAYGVRNFWKIPNLKWSRMEAVLTIMFIVDLLMALLQMQLQLRLAMPFRCLRLSAVVCKAKNVGHIVDVFALTLLNTWKVLLFIVVFILIFGAIGVHIFMDDYHFISCENKTGIIDVDKEYCEEDEEHIYTGAYDHIGLGSLRLFSLLSTENYPEIIVPAYKNREANFFYFCIFVFVGHFILMSVLTARIVEKYWEYSKQNIKEERKQERTKLAKAWNILDDEGFGQMGVDDDRLLCLLTMIRPKLTSEEVSEITDYVDEDGDGMIDVFEWTTRLTDALGYEAITEDKDCTITNLHHGTRIDTVFRNCRKIASATGFRTAILVVVMSHCILFCCKWYNMTFREELVVQGLKTGIICLFTIELIIKAIGLNKHLKDPFEILDLLCSIVAILSNIMWYLVPFVIQVYDQFTYHGALAVVSGLAVFCRLGFISKPARAGMVSLLRILPVMLDLLILVVIITYLYGIIGLEIFQGIEPVYWYDSDHWDYDCDLGFKSFACSLMQVFQICTTSNWHEIMNAAMIASNGWASLYFVTCYAIIDMLIMSLFVAITSEAIKRLADSEESEDEPIKSSTKSRSRSETTTSKTQTRLQGAARTIFGSMFATSRLNPAGGRRQSLAAVNVRRRSAAGSPTSPVALVEPNINLKRASIFSLHSRGGDSDSLDEVIKENDGCRKPSYSEIRSKRLMERLERRKQRRGRVMLAVEDYKADSDSELPLCEGDEVEVVDTAGTMIKGVCGGRTGWFPANVVVEMTKRSMSVKKRINKVEPYQAGGDTQMKSSDFDSSLSTEGTRKGPKRKISNIVKGNHGGWRRQILGDITVMNKDEILELNRIVNAPIKIKSRRSIRKHRRRSSTASVVIAHSPDTQAKKDKKRRSGVSSLSNLPSIEVQSISSLSHIEDKPDDDLSPGDESPYQLSVKAMAAKPRRRKSAAKGGEMPDWVKTFMSAHNR